MENLIDLKAYPVANVLDKLLQDKTTKRNIIFATDAYKSDKLDAYKTTEITSALLYGLDTLSIQPRVLKSQQEQAERTKKKAEVFTPAWICNRMNNHCDEEWFGRKDVFNKEVDTKDGKHTWVITEGNIEFPKKKRWQRYVDSKRLEITCGEAPYIVSRYDAATGEYIPVRERIGILDRKLRIVGENTDNYDDWLKWTYRAFQSVYGYEFQGDNLLIARINLLVSFAEHMQERWQKNPTKRELNKVVNYIVWNIWQMDGLTGLVPFSKPVAEQNSLFDFVLQDGDAQNKSVYCRIRDWRAQKSLTFNSIKENNRR